jgi:ABC-type multidrug transport system fused ATPase/permease subunit
VQILVDGKDITEVDAGEYRRQIGVVPQDPHLLSMSIADNIACALLCPSFLPGAAFLSC